MSLDTLSDLLYLQQNADLTHLQATITPQACKAAWNHWVSVKQARAHVAAEAGAQVDVRKRLASAVCTAQRAAKRQKSDESGAGGSGHGSAPAPQTTE